MVFFQVISDSVKADSLANSNTPSREGAQAAREGHGASVGATGGPWVAKASAAHKGREGGTGTAPSLRTKPWHHHPAPHELRTSNSQDPVPLSLGPPEAQWPRNHCSECLLPSFPNLPPSLRTSLLPWTEVAVYFSSYSYSFLRLRWQDKVLGGEPNSRFQGHARAMSARSHKSKYQRNGKGAEKH